MKRFFTWMGLAVLVWARLAGAAEHAPLIGGEDADLLTAADVTNICRVGGLTASNLWLVEARHITWVRPNMVVVQAYEAAAVANSRVRRGVSWVFAAEDAPSPTQRAWRQMGQKDYVRITTTNAPAFPAKVPARYEMPFELMGDVTDSDLIEGVAYARGAPLPREESDITKQGLIRITVPDAVDGMCRILTVKKTAAEVLEIRTECRPGGGQIMELKQKDGKWTVKSLRNWAS